MLDWASYPYDTREAAQAGRPSLLRPWPVHVALRDGAPVLVAPPDMPARDYHRALALLLPTTPPNEVVHD